MKRGLAELLFKNRVTEIVLQHRFARLGFHPAGIASATGWWLLQTNHSHSNDPSTHTKAYILLSGNVSHDVWHATRSTRYGLHRSRRQNGSHNVNTDSSIKPQMRKP